jgi:glyoxylase-like metal-dependent hydrolase (beta-lactamase superfamily II)
VGPLITLIGSPDNLKAQSNDWTEPLPPFKIAGNLYYVGTKGLANYLITTPKGHILINSDMEENVSLIRASVEKLSFKFTDIKMLLISHAHRDHDAASDTIKKLTVDPAGYKKYVKGKEQEFNTELAKQITA